MIDLRKRPTVRQLRDRFIRIGLILLTTILLVFLAWMIGRIIQQGMPYLSWELLDRFPSRFPQRAGIKSALWGTIYHVLLTMLFSVPLGFGAAVYLEEFMPLSRWKRFIELNIANLAGVPAIVYGILGLGIFVRYMDLGRSLIAGALTATLLILPTIITAAREALKAVPKSLRDAAFAVGATRLQVVWSHVLPAAMPGMLTGVILATSRAIGETAPLILIGALSFVAFVPETIFDSFTTIPIQIFNWASRPQEEFHALAAAAIVVLLTILLAINLIAIVCRSYLDAKQKRFKIGS